MVNPTFNFISFIRAFGSLSTSQCALFFNSLLNVVHQRVDNLSNDPRTYDLSKLGLLYHLFEILIFALKTESH